MPDHLLKTEKPCPCCGYYYYVRCHHTELGSGCDTQRIEYAIHEYDLKRQKAENDDV